MDAGFIFPDYI